MVTPDHFQNPVAEGVTAQSGHLVRFEPLRSSHNGEERLPRLPTLPRLPVGLRTIPGNVGSLGSLLRKPFWRAGTRDASTDQDRGDTRPGHRFAGRAGRHSPPGVDVARINFSHGTPEEHISRIARFRAAAERVGRFAGVLADLPGPKLRVKLPAPRELAIGDTDLVLAVG